jgi:hypothetical protein
MTQSRLIVAAIVLAFGVAGGHAGQPGQTRVLAQAATPLPIPAPAGETPPGTTPPESTAPAMPPAVAPAPPPAEPPPAAEPAAPDVQASPPAEPPSEDDGDTPPDELSLGEIPVIETMELTPDIAKRALDSYIGAKQKYSESDLEQYENLQDFVDQTPEGKNFEADIKAAGFASVSDWNLAITTLGLSYGSVIDDQTGELELQIREVEGDTELAQDIKDRMVKALKAMIPSENNKKVIEDLLADPVYGPKLAELDIEEE